MDTQLRQTVKGWIFNLLYNLIVLYRNRIYGNSKSQRLGSEINLTMKIHEYLKLKNFMYILHPEL